MAGEPNASTASPSPQTTVWDIVLRILMIVWAIVLGALALANLGFAIARIVDAVIAAGGQQPPFSLLLPTFIQDSPRLQFVMESRPLMLAVVLAMPALSMLLPMILLAPGAGAFIRRRGPGKAWIWPVALLAAGVLCLAANVLCAYVPELSEGLLYRLTCPGWYMVIPGLAVAAGILGHLLRRGEGKLGAWMTVLLTLGGGCLIANAITTYIICYAKPSM